ncbi:MAG: hypothetical protein OXG85_15985 [Chloroflexi bacterium]|nr:hypothetical protein [Chloroflexota bacterium]
MPERWDIVLRSACALPRNFVVERRLEGFIANAQRPHLQVAEMDAAGAIVDAFVPCQLDRDAGGARAVFLLAEATATASARYFCIQLADIKPPGDELIELRQGVLHQEQESYQISTPGATYFYHERGAGFASLIDRDGNDWISYRPFGGSDGAYRGIPNLAHPENYFHPGGTGCRSRILNAGPLKITIASESVDGQWACRWEVYPTQARLTVLKVGHPYWFLYEGTPGGALDEAGDYCVTSDGRRRALSERWEGALPQPEWIYFGAPNADRVLYLAHHESDQLMDSYWPMEGNMTVFGFGRDGLTKFMTETPARFTIGFAETKEFAAVRELIGAVTQPVSISEASR